MTIHTEEKERDVMIKVVQEKIRTFMLEPVEGIMWFSFGKPPNKFHRFMMRLFFGWKFTLLK